jgi:hypothetical protein
MGTTVHMTDDNAASTGKRSTSRQPDVAIVSATRQARKDGLHMTARGSETDQLQQQDTHILESPPPFIPISKRVTKAHKRVEIPESFSPHSWSDDSVRDITYSPSHVLKTTTDSDSKESMSFSPDVKSPKKLRKKVNKSKSKASKQPTVSVAGIEPGPAQSQLSDSDLGFSPVVTPPITSVTVHRPTPVLGVLGSTAVAASPVQHGIEPEPALVMPPRKQWPGCQTKGHSRTRTSTTRAQRQCPVCHQDKTQVIRHMYAVHARTLSGDSFRMLCVRLRTCRVAAILCPA